MENNWNELFLQKMNQVDDDFLKKKDNNNNKKNSNIILRAVMLMQGHIFWLILDNQTHGLLNKAQTDC